MIQPLTIPSKNEQAGKMNKRIEGGEERGHLLVMSCCCLVMFYGTIEDKQYVCITMRYAYLRREV